METNRPAITAPSAQEEGRLALQVEARWGLKTSRPRESGLDGYFARAMARGAGLPAPVIWTIGITALLVAMTLDSFARAGAIRLVPLYVPILCVISWGLGRWQALLFAILAAMVANLPDMMVAPDAIGAATISNAAIRAASYIFLSLIIGAFRRSYDEADLRAMYDGLTGVLNKLPFHAMVARQLAAARRTGTILLIGYVDLDGFKAINTLHGHAIGDAALRCFSEEALAAIRGSDAVGRLGGDEFGFLLTAASEREAETLAHLLHQRLMHSLEKTGLPLSCSMGALVVPQHCACGEGELIAEADRLMLRAKAAGKSQVLTDRAAA